MERKKVLMLGWEFPPILSGGLGVACLGLCKALSKHVTLTLILPKSTTGQHIKGMEIVGLSNTEEKEEIKSGVYTYDDPFVEVLKISSDINPYYSGKEEGPPNKKHFAITITSEDNKDNIDISQFRIDHLYGSDVRSKVIAFSKAAVNLAKNRQFDVIHCHDWMTFLAGVEIKRQSGKPLILHLHSLEYDRGGENSLGWIYALEKSAMEQADLIIPVSFYTAEVIKRHYGITNSKIHPIHNGVDPVAVFHAQKPFPEKLVLFLGRVTDQKGPQFFLEVAEKVLRKVPDTRFVVAGTGDKFSDVIENGAGKHLGHKVHFTGFINREKVHQLLAISDIYCMPSVSEPFGLSALEAAQFDIPCIVSRQSGVAEVLKGALKSDFWDTEKIADHITALLKNEDLRKKLVEEARRSLKSCTWEAAAAKVNKAYNMVIKSQVAEKTVAEPGLTQ